MNLDSFIDELATTKPGALLFNPYRDSSKHDVLLAPEIRQQNLRNYLAGFPASPRVLLLGEAPSPSGARWTGVAFTSERQLPGLPFRALPTSRQAGTYTELSGSIVWGLVGAHWPHVMQWNCVPWLPHQAQNPAGIRTPDSTEIRLHLPLLEAFLAKVRPRTVVAVGRSAESALRMLERPYTLARHPARGGANQFRQDVGRVLKRAGVAEPSLEAPLAS